MKFSIFSKSRSRLWATILLAVFMVSCGESPKGVETKKPQPPEVPPTSIAKPTEKKKAAQQKEKSQTKKDAIASAKTELEGECIFDVKTQTDSFIRNIPEFANYHWIERKKTAAIQLENGDSIYAHRGGCHHFGVDATWIQQSDSTIHNTVYWVEKATWLAERIYDPSLQEEFKEKLRALDYEISPGKNRWVMAINHDYFSEWWITLKVRPDGKTVLSTGYYFG